MRKSQAAMEFLMTYGWALLVVIIVIAALAFFGLLNPARFLPEKCEIAPGITCLDFNARSGTSDLTNISILVSNGLGTPMTVHQINLTNCISAVGLIGTNGSWPNGATLGIVNEGSSANFSLLGGCINAYPGSRFRSDIIFTYNVTVMGTIITHVKKGFISVQVD